MKLSPKIVSVVAAGILMLGIGGVTAESASAATITTIKETCTVALGSYSGYFTVQPYHSKTVYIARSGVEVPKTVSAGANPIQYHFTLVPNAPGNCAYSGQYSTRIF